MSPTGTEELRTVFAILASRMLGSLAFVLAKAEERLARGEVRF